MSRRPSLLQRRCEFCGARLTATLETAKYCSGKCRGAAYRANLGRARADYYRELLKRSEDWRAIHQIMSEDISEEKPKKVEEQ